MTKIKVIGIGGSGNNTVSRMKNEKIEKVELVAMNTDYQDLDKIDADIKLRIGKKITQGLGTGMRPEIGEAAARESYDEISQILKGADIIFITYGAGGGTGSGAGPVIAEIAKNLGILTIAIVTLPFLFEGQTRMKIAKEGIAKLKEKVDSLIVIKNDRLLEILEPKTSIFSAFAFCDEVLKEGVIGISNLVNSVGIININFADVKTILQNSGNAIFAQARAFGEKRAENVAMAAINSPLLNINQKGAKGVLFYVAGNNILISEVEEIGKILTKEINPQAKVIFGAKEDKNLRADEIRLLLIATGFDKSFDF